MHAVSKLDHQGAHVLTHRDDEFTNRFSLSRVAVFDLGNLGHAVYQAGHRVAKLFAALVQRVIRVLHCVMQQTSCHDTRSHTQIGENLRHAQRVNYVRLARAATFQTVLPHRAVIRLTKNSEVSLRVMLTHLLQNRSQRIARNVRDFSAQLAGAHVNPVGRVLRQWVGSSSRLSRTMASVRRHRRHDWLRDLTSDGVIHHLLLLLGSARMNITRVGSRECCKTANMVFYFLAHRFLHPSGPITFLTLRDLACFVTNSRNS